MKTLFFKVFGMLFGSFLLVTVLCVGMLWWINTELHPDETHIEFRARQSAEDLVDAWIAGDFDQARKQLMRKRHVRAWLLDANEQPLVGRPVPPPIMNRVTEYPSFIVPRRGERNREIIYAALIERQDTEFRVVLATDQRAFRDANRGRFGGVFIALMLFAFAVATLLLAWWILRPLKAIRGAAAAITADDLSARVPKLVTRRRDAFGDLGNEFNQMTDRLERSVESQRQLLRDVSHELRTPLARIQVANSLSSQRHGENEEVSRIETEVSRLDSMIEGLLTLSRLQQGDTLKRSYLDLRPLLEDLAADARYEFQDDGKQVELHLAHRSNVSGDPVLIGRALENILRNAMRYTPPESAVEVATVERDGFVIITIEDKGPGVAESDLERIFDAFFKADSARSPDSQDGHGVGLAMARAIVQLHNGSLSASHATDSGLIQTVTLPRV